ncbi:hypothetical protein NGB00_02125 [Staphylococcus pseudoxylosus]|nr:hypothetical protein [Staphylococcus pseudoxylosus]
MKAIAKQNLLSKVKQKLIDNWVDQSRQKLYDFSPWRNKNFWGVINNTLETNETIFAAITKLSNSMASIPIKLYKNYESVTNDISLLITDTPNGSISSFDFIQRLRHRLRLIKV